MWVLYLCVNFCYVSYLHDKNRALSTDFHFMLSYEIVRANDIYLGIIRNNPVQTTRLPIITGIFTWNNPAHSLSHTQNRLVCSKTTSDENNSTKAYNTYNKRCLSLYTKVWFPLILSSAHFPSRICNMSTHKLYMYTFWSVCHVISYCCLAPFQYIFVRVWHST